MTKKEEKNKSLDSALDPIARISEILFGLIMVLTFTGSLRAVDIGREDVKEMLIGAIGCNLAWGIIDAMMFLMAALTARARTNHLIKLLSETKDAEAGRIIVQSALPEGLSEILNDQHLDYIGQKAIEKRKELPSGLTKRDIWGAIRVFFLVFVSTLPAVIPFLILKDPYQALRVSNLIALLMLFWLGRVLAQYSGKSPLLWGTTMMLLGAALVSMTIALGG